jgi:hypothetical protein
LPTLKRRCCRGLSWYVVGWRVVVVVAPVLVREGPSIGGGVSSAHRGGRAKVPGLDCWPCRRLSSVVASLVVGVVLVTSLKKKGCERCSSTSDEKRKKRRGGGGGGRRGAAVVG